MSYNPPLEVVQCITDASPITKIRNEFGDIDGYIMNLVHSFEVNVDKDELLKALEYDRDQYNKGYDDGFTRAIRHGHWIDKKIYEINGVELHSLRCSHCGKASKYLFVCGLAEYKYCPNCGAKMDEVEE